MEKKKDLTTKRRLFNPTRARTGELVILLLIVSVPSICPIRFTLYTNFQFLLLHLWRLKTAAGKEKQAWEAGALHQIEESLLQRLTERVVKCGVAGVLSTVKGRKCCVFGTTEHSMKWPVKRGDNEHIQTYFLSLTVKYIHSDCHKNALLFVM